MAKPDDKPALQTGLDVADEYRSTGSSSPSGRAPSHSSWPTVVFGGIGSALIVSARRSARSLLTVAAITLLFMFHYFFGPRA
jgi:hypothetical protein